MEAIHPVSCIHTVTAQQGASAPGVASELPVLRKVAQSCGRLCVGLEVTEREGRVTGAVAPMLPFVSTPQVQAAGILCADLFKELGFAAVWTQRGVCPRVCGQVLSTGILDVTGRIAASCGSLSRRQSLYVTSMPHSHPQLMAAAWLWGQEDRNRQAWSLRQAHRQAGQSSRALSVNYGTRACGAGTNHEAVRHRKRH